MRRHDGTGPAVMTETDHATWCHIAAIQAGVGEVYAKTSVDVTGNGAGTASAGGSIGISGGNVKVSTWGETSAEVF